MSEFKQYRRKQIAELADWYDWSDMTGVSISEADKANGSPKVGDKIARNPKNHADRWLVAEEYFHANFEPVAAADAERLDWLEKNPEVITPWLKLGPEFGPLGKWCRVRKK